MKLKEREEEEDEEVEEAVAEGRLLIKCQL